MRYRSYPKNWFDVRRNIVQRDKSCTMCGSTINLVVHHAIPLSRGGTNAEINLMTLCTTCHSRKHTHLFKGDQDGIRKRR